MVDFKKADIDTGDDELYETGSTDDLDSDTGPLVGSDREDDTELGTDVSVDTVDEVDTVDTGTADEVDTVDGVDTGTADEVDTGTVDEVDTVDSDSGNGVALDDYIAFFPFSTNTDDFGPNNISLLTSSPAPILDVDREGNADASYLFTAADGTYFYNDDLTSVVSVDNELTVSVWVNLKDSTADQKIVGRAYKHPSTGEFRGWVLSVVSGQLYSEIWDEQGRHFAFVKGTVPTGAWTHLAITWKTGEKLRGYVDGVEVAEMDASTAPIGDVAGCVLRIGARPWSFPKFFVDGNIDDIRIYDRELTGDLVAKLKDLPAD